MERIRERESEGEKLVISLVVVVACSVRLKSFLLLPTTIGLNPTILRSNKTYQVLRPETSEDSRHSLAGRPRASRVGEMLREGGLFLLLGAGGHSLAAWRAGVCAR